ncbi:MAG: 33 kDa chaperonin [marine bacterium B5-7]|nr:MAG: 33 kDa chaperonin [marine bacterium B5-7]
MQSHDAILRFTFEDFNVRGQIARLESTYQEVLEQCEYPDEVRILLGELLAATALLSSTVKFSGSLSLQVNTDGRVRLLMAECRNQADLRAIARLDETLESTSDVKLGEGKLVITIEPDDGNRYQGIVNFEQGSLARALENYFRQSEQLNTRLWLAADARRAGGLMLQCLPPRENLPSIPVSEEDWQRVTLLAETVRNEELLDLEASQTLTRLFHEEEVRTFDPRSLRFHCSCSRERSANAIKFLGFDDAMTLIDEQGEVQIDCQFCHARYLFSNEDVKSVFEEEVAPRGTTIH